MDRQRGFTLLEILVALAILAVGLAAAIRAGLAATQTADALRERQLAGWVAENQLALLRATRASPPPGETGGEALMGGLRLRWLMRVAPAAQGHFRRVEVSVFRTEEADAPLARLIGYLAAP